MTGRRLQPSVLIVLTLFLLAAPANAQDHACRAVSESPSIRVGLESSIGKPSSLVVVSEEGIRIADAESAQCLETCEGQAVRLTPKDGQIEVAPNGEDPLLLASPVTLSANNDGVIEIREPKVSFGKYRGCLVVSGSTALSVVNELPLEDYVKGVVPNEADPRFHPEAQKALAIAIRTYALRSKLARRHTYYDVCTSTHCQGFSGAAREADWVNKVVDETRGQVVTFEGQPICAAYSSSCGGATSSNEAAGFGTEPLPYLRPVVDNECGKPSPVSIVEDSSWSAFCDDYCAGGKSYTWMRKYSPQELSRAFSRVKGAIVGDFESMEFTDYDSSGRVGTVVVRSRINPPEMEPENGQTAEASDPEPPRVALERAGKLNEYRLPGYKFRTLFGEAIIMSTRMSLTVTPEGDYIIEGKGWGHGVGLCSAGANGMAERGKTCDEILKHYYTGVEISAIGK